MPRTRYCWAWLWRTLPPTLRLFLLERVGHFVERQVVLEQLVRIDDRPGTGLM